MSFNPEKPGQPAPKKSKNMLYNIVGGGALSAALLFGGAAWVTNGATPSYAQTSQTSTSAVDQAQTSNSQTQQTAPNQQTAPTQQTNGQNQPPLRGPGGRGPAGGPAGDHGGPGGPGGKGGDLSGTLTSLNGNVLTLKRDNAVNIVATVTSSTKYTQAGQTINQSDLKTGERLRIEETHDSSGTATISQVDVVLDHSGGAISAISSDSLTLTRPDNTTVKVALNSSTTYYDLNNKISQGDLKSGEKVDVEGLTGSDGTLTAQVVHVHHDRTDGTVTAVNGNTITIQMGGPGGNGGPGGRGPGGRGPGGQPGATNNGTANNGNAANGSQQPTNPPAPAGSAVTTITVSGSTVYNEAGQSAQLSDIKVGTHISAVGELSSDGKSLNALQVMIQLPSYHGQVASVSGNTITIQDRNGTKTVEVNSNTKYLNGTASAALSDVKAGVNIEAQGQLDSNGKLTASVIQLGQPQGPQHP